MNRKHNHSSLHHQQQPPQQYYSQDVVHDQATCAFPPSPREMYSHQLPGHPGTLNGRQHAGVGGKRAPPAVPERSPDTHLTSQPHSSRKSSISSRSSTSSSELCNEVNEVFDASLQHTHQHQFNPAAACNSRAGENRPFSYAAGIDLRVLQQRQQGGSSNGNSLRLRGVSDGYAVNMSCGDTQGSGFHPYSETESWRTDVAKRGGGDGGSGLNGHVHGHPVPYHPGASSVRPSQQLPICGPTLDIQHFSPGNQHPPPPPSQMYQGQRASQPPQPPSPQVYQGQYACQPPPLPPSQMFQGQRVSQPPGGAVLPGAVSSTKPFPSHHHIVTKPNPSPPASRKSSSSSCHSPVSNLTEPPTFHGRAAVPPPPSFPAPPPPLHTVRCVTEAHEMRSPSPPLPPPPPEMLMSSVGLQSTISTIPPPQPTVSSPQCQHASHGQAGAHGSQPVSGLAAELTQVKLRKAPQPDNGIGQPVKEGEEVLSPLGIRLKPTQGKFSNIYQKDEDSQEEALEPLPPADPAEADVQGPDPQEKEEDTSGIPHTSLDAESLISAALSKMDLDIPDDIDITQCPGLVEITKATPNWKREMIEKKNRDKIEEYVKQILKDREQAAKWRNVPEWKRALLMKKDQEELGAGEKPAVVPETMPKSVKKVGSSPGKGDKGDNPPPPVSKPKGEKVPAALNIDPAELESMPPWKRELLFKREKVPASFFNEFQPDEEDEKNVCGQVPIDLREDQS